MYRTQIWAPFRGSVHIIFTALPGDTSDAIARRIKAAAVDMFEKQWTFPDCDKNAMRCLGLTDGRRELNRYGERVEVEPVSLEGAKGFPKVREI